MSNGDEDRRWSRSGVIAAWIGVVLMAIPFMPALLAHLHLDDSASSSTPSPAHQNTAPVLDRGACLTSGLAVVGCGESHSWEVAAGNDCGVDVAITHLGGDPQLDAVKPSVKTRAATVGDQKVCLVGQEGASFVGTLRDVLSGEHGEQFRWCRVTITGVKDVDCGSPHDEEVLGKARPGQDCRSMLARYMGRHDAPTELDASQKVIDGTSRCAVSATASQRLNRTLRGLENRALPIA